MSPSIVVLCLSLFALNKEATEVWLAVTEKGLSSAVSRGENAGNNLHHTAVLRMMQKLGVADGNKGITLAFEGKPSAKFKSNWTQDDRLCKRKKSANLGRYVDDDRELVALFVSGSLAVRLAR